MLAQSLGEYSATSGRVSDSAQQLTDSIRNWIGDVSPATWMAIVAVVVALWFFNRRPTRP